MSRNPLTGGCLCQTIRFQVNSITGHLCACHCKTCQKASSSAFIPWAITDLKLFEWIKGKKEIKRYQSSSNFSRNFCLNCGSQLPVEDADRKKVYIPAGTLDESIDQTIHEHWFMKSNPEWHVIGDTAPQFKEYP